MTERDGEILHTLWGNPHKTFLKQFQQNLTTPLNSPWSNCPKSIWLLIARAISVVKISSEKTPSRNGFLGVCDWCDCIANNHRSGPTILQHLPGGFFHQDLRKSVDNEGFDPSTSRMLSVRSTNWASRPLNRFYTVMLVTIGEKNSNTYCVLYTWWRIDVPSILCI